MPRAAPRAPRLSIVVLPFTNLSNDPEQQYFADGITEDLTTDLSRIADSFVISRNTAFTYKDKPVNAKQIGRELGVRYVLEGSVRRSGNRVRVNAQLIDAETDAHLWAERFDGDTGDLFALGNEITSRIAIDLDLELIAAEAARPTENPDALDYILRGRAALSKPHSRDNYAEAIGLFERALALDPHSVEAQSRLASALAGRVLDYTPSSSDSDLKRAEELVAQALAASPAQPDCALRQRPSAARAGATHRSHSRIRDGPRVRPQLGGRISQYRPGARPSLGRSRKQSRSLSKPFASVRAIATSESGMTGLGKCTCCNRASTRRSSGSKGRAALIRNYHSFTLHLAVRLRPQRRHRTRRRGTCRSPEAARRRFLFEHRSLVAVGSQFRGARPEIRALVRGHLFTPACARPECPRSNGLDPPSCRDPRRRCGGLFAPDGSGRGRDARTPQSASPAAVRSEDCGAPRPHRQDHWRRLAWRNFPASSTQCTASTRYNVGPVRFSAIPARRSPETPASRPLDGLNHLNLGTFEGYKQVKLGASARRP